MSTDAATLVEGPRDWLRRHGRSVFRSKDAWVGAGMATVAGVAVGFSKGIDDHAVTILLAEAATGVALSSVVLAALAVFATFFDDAYRRVLEAASDRHSIRDALVPYVVVATLAGLTAVFGLVIALLWPALPLIPKVLGLALVTGLASWTIAGTIQLVWLTAWHAEQRSMLMRGIDEATSLAQRRKQKASA